MGKNQKKIVVLIVAFVLVFAVSVVYAATNGILAFQGTSDFQANVDLNIISHSIVSAQTGELISLSADSNTLTFNTIMQQPGDSRTIQFSITNVGNTSATLDQLITNSPEVGSGLLVTWPNLDDVVVAAGATVGPYTIVTAWDSTVPGANGEQTYSATIDYDQTPTS